MIDILYNSNIAFIGGGSICKEILETILGRYFNDLNLTVIGVADTNNKAKGLTYAKKKGLFTTKDYKELLKIKGIDLIIELTGDYNVLNELKVSKPSQAKLIDHIEAMSIQHFLQIEEKIIKIKRNLIKQYNDHEKIEKEFEPFSNELINIIKNKVQDIQAIEKDLKERTKNVQLLEKDLIEKVKAIYEEEREKYNILFETDPNPIFIIDSQTYKILDVNKRAQDCYEYSKEELLQKSFLELGDEKEEEFVAKLKALNEDQCVFFSKKRHYRKDRHQFYVNINVCHSSYHENHEDNAFIVTTTDISESTEKEIQLIQTSKMTTLGTMAAGIAHELNQPLNVIQIGADFFLKKIRKEEPIENKDLYTIASEINTNVQRAAEIINQLRNFARQSEVVG
ncbi:MAG: PAS domain S-box protein, partial [archaeon]|nr:PAS domain S-box protein [archaeon]